MSAAAILRECHQRGIRLFPQPDSKLLVQPASKLTDELRQAIRANKPGILAALAHEDAAEYVAERTAICAADRLPPAHLRPVFKYCLSDDPRTQLIMLGYAGETLDEARASLYDRFGDRVLSVGVYQWPPQPAVLQ